MNIIQVPTVSVNETEVKLLLWSKKQGDQVKKNEMICEVETTKSTYEVETNFAGYLYYILAEGTTVEIGSPLAIVTENKEQDYQALFANLIDAKSKGHLNSIENTLRRFTKKAEIIAQKAGVVIKDIQSDENLITEEILLAFIEKKKLPSPDISLAKEVLQKDLRDIIDGTHQVNRQERVLILGAGGGCNLVIDSLSSITNQRAAFILDNSPSTHNKTFMGINVLGGFNLIEELWEGGKFDAVISTVVKDIDERAEIFDNLVSKGIPFTNVIDPNASIRLNVNMGKGNLIVNGCYLAPSVTIGNNNFLAAHTCVEHHGLVGSHCTFGPRFTASGKVTIGNKCKFGTGVFVEPFVNIGANTTVASGAVITNHIPENSIVKTENKLRIQSKSK